MDVSIAIDLTKSHQKHVLVSYSISNISSDELVLSFPTWSPGSYLIREYQAQVEDFTATDPHGKKLKFSKLNKCQWLVHTENNYKIKFSYRVYANDFNVRGIYSDHELVFANPTSLFFYLEGHLDLPVQLKIKHPPSWTLAYPQKPKGKIYEFKEFDSFLDAPILCAKDLKIAKFDVRKTHYKMAFWGKHNGDIDQIVKDTREIVSKEVKIFKDNPCKEYLFQVLFVPKKFGGLEHSYSSTNIFDGSILGSKKDYKKFLALLAHEHFHLWNVKRIRPRELGPFDYTKEIYTRELWMAEGITSYYDDHVVMRAGMLSSQEYLSLLAENITKLMANKSSKVNSISESSFDAWIRFYRQNENSINTVVSYYLKGGLVMMLLDLHIIKMTKGKFHFDDVMHILYKIYKKRPEVGFTREEFLEVVEGITKKSCKKFFSDYIDGVKTISWKSEFEPFGLEFKKNKKEEHNYLGVILGEVQGRVSIKAIAEDSPAHDSILQPGDEVIAIDGDRLTSLMQFDHYLKKDKIDLILSRLGKILEAEIKLSENSTPTYHLKIKDKIRPAQKRLLDQFLRR